MAEQPEGKPPSKAQRIRDLAGQGKSIAEIQKAVGVTYQHVYNTLRYSTNMQDGKEVQKASKARLHHRDNGPRSLEEREEMRKTRERLAQGSGELTDEEMEKLRAAGVKEVGG